MADFLALLLLTAASSVAARNLTFPDDFLFGAGSASYQVEGGWNADGKGESIWDRNFHPGGVENTSVSNGDMAADSYHNYKEDVKAAKEIGLNFYRFSISWPRVLPQGDLSVINQAGLNYYNNLINELKENNIEPIITMYHWDLPQHLQDLGGLVNDIIIDYFEDYANLLFTHFGDRVKWWITFNEPLSFVAGYNIGKFAPKVVAPNVGKYLVAHNILKAHARVYHVYDEQYKTKQKGKVSITLDMQYPLPRTNTTADLDATERFLQFDLGWFAHPIYSKEGDYPAIMKERIANNSKQEGLPRSRLPVFSEHWIKYIRGSFDFYAMNLYTSRYITANKSLAPSTASTGGYDMGAMWTWQDDKWPAAEMTNFRYTPFGMRNMLKWISDNYNNVPILITENGWCDSGELNDTMKIRFLVNYYAAVLDAIYLDNVKVLGHSTWSLIDTFEWNTYRAKFGLYRVDFSDPKRPRTARESSKIVASIIKTRKLPEQYLDKEE